MQPAVCRAVCHSISSWRVVILINSSGTPREDLSVIVDLPNCPSQATQAGNGSVAAESQNGRLVYRLDFDMGPGRILRQAK